MEARIVSSRVAFSENIIMKTRTVNIKGMTEETDLRNYREFVGTVQSELLTSITDTSLSFKFAA
jgi:hypothetical protein